LALFLCDNESVVKTVNKIQQYGTKTKDYLSPNFNVLNAINTVWRILKQQGIDIKIQHIKSHQDQITKNLSHRAYLNTVVDKLATLAIQFHEPNQQLAPMADATL
jgi:hypothetical protein